MKLTRRRFIKKSLESTAMIGAGMSITNPVVSTGKHIISMNNVTAQIPLPIQVVIDDVGWWSGKDGSTYQEPYRTGIQRNHVPADYQAIVDLGRALGIRPQAAMVLGEWDRDNLLRKIPHSTWMGEKWDNGRWVGPWLEEASDIINSNKHHFELTMHGLGHEWWKEDGTFTRAEWADNEGIMRPKKDIERHLDAFAEILKQNNLGELPTSFVPTAFRHGFGVTPGNKVSIAELLNKRGFTYINTPFVIMRNKEKAQRGIFGVDSGLLTVDRGADIFDWDIIGPKPEGVINGSTCGMHWPNLLHEEPEKNAEIVDGWIKFLAPYNDRQETMLAKNSKAFQKQLAHHACTKVDVVEGLIHLDFKETDKLGTIVANDEFTVKVNSNEELIFSSDSVRIVSVKSKKRKDSILYNLELKKIDRQGAVVTFKNT